MFCKHDPGGWLFGGVRAQGLSLQTLYAPEAVGRGSAEVFCAYDPGVPLSARVLSPFCLPSAVATNLHCIFQAALDMADHHLGKGTRLGAA